MKKNKKMDPSIDETVTVILLKAAPSDLFSKEGLFQELKKQLNI